MIPSTLGSVTYHCPRAYVSASFIIDQFIHTFQIGHPIEENNLIYKLWQSSTSKYAYFTLAMVLAHLVTALNQSNHALQLVRQVNV